MGVAVSSLWISCFFVTFTFPFIMNFAGLAGGFWFYALICLAGTIFVFRLVPETKNRSLEEIEREFLRRH